MRRIGAICLALSLIVVLMGCSGRIPRSTTSLATSLKDAPLSPPTELQTSSAGYADGIHLVWSSVQGASWYSVFRSNARTGTYVNLATTRRTDWDDLGVVPGREYYYRVSASKSPLSDAAQSAPSDIAVGRVGQGGDLGAAQALRTPTALAASGGTYADKIHVSWKPTDGATWYNIYRATKASGPFASVATTRGTSWDDTKISPDIVYYYEVSASDGLTGTAKQSATSECVAGYASSI